jgi:uncharacterized membrane protein YkvA (DUF1232 family)
VAAASATPADPRRQTPDRFPREAVVALVRRLPAYARLGWALSREPALSRGRRAAVVAAAAYLVSPIDLVPGIIPLAGQLDDAAIALLGLRFALRGLPAARRDVHLAAAGVTASQLDEDLATVGRSAAWLARGAGRATTRIGIGTGRIVGRGARAAWRRFR